MENDIIVRLGAIFEIKWTKFHIVFPFFHCEISSFENCVFRYSVSLIIALPIIADLHHIRWRYCYPCIFKWNYTKNYHCSRNMLSFEIIYWNKLATSIIILSAIVLPHQARIQGEVPGVRTPRLKPQVPFLETNHQKSSRNNHRTCSRLPWEPTFENNYNQKISSALFETKARRTREHSP